MNEICVLMSSYNGEHYIRAQIDSILRQKSCRIHLHVRDDGSSDHTVDILKEYENKGVLTLHQGPNLGPAFSFLQLLKETPGFPWYAWADQDDIWFENKLSDGMNHLKALDVPALCYANAELIDSQGHPMGIRVYRKYHPVKKNTIACVGAMLGCTMVFNHHLAKCIQQYDLPKRIRMHDYYLAQVCLACGGQILYSDTVCMGYRQHEKNVVGMKSGKLSALNQRIHDMLVIRDPSVADHAKEICRIYQTCMNKENKKLFDQIAHYKDSFINRLVLLKLFNGKDVSYSMRLKYRVMILLGRL